MNDAPACWGKCVRQSNHCRRCPYTEACEIITRTDPALRHPLGGQDFDAVSRWATDLATGECTPDAADAKTEPFAGDLAELLRYLLNLDNYTLGVLAELIAPSRNPCRSVADLARLHGISRQGMHRKMLRMARQAPELASLLQLTVKKIQKSRRDFTAPRRSRKRGTRLKG